MSISRTTNDGLLLPPSPLIDSIIAETAAGNDTEEKEKRIAKIASEQLKEDRKCVANGEAPHDKAVVKKTVKAMLGKTFDELNFFNTPKKPQELTQWLEKITEIKGLTQADALAALARYVFHHKLRIDELLLRLGKETVFSMAPYLYYVDLRYLSDANIDWGMELLQKCSKVKYLLINNEKITELPKGLSSLVKLQCIECYNLTALPEDLHSLRELFCGDCTKLVSLPKKLPSLQKLICHECGNLCELPEDLPALRQLIFTYCPSLFKLPKSLPQLQALTCSNNSSLAFLPEELPLLRTLDIFGCDNLQELPRSLPSLERQDCRAAPKITPTAQQPLCQLI